LDLSKYVTGPATPELYKEASPKLTAANSTQYALTLPAYGYVVWSIQQLKRN